MKPGLVIIGAGGAGCEALWVARRMGAQGTGMTYKVLGFSDDAPALAGTMVDGLPVLGPVARILAEYGGRGVYFHCAIGNNGARKKVAEQFEAAGFVAATLIDPSAVVAETARIGAGTYVGPQSNVSPFAQVGRCVLINTQVSTGHHAQVGDFAQLCPGARVSGNCRVEEGAFVGSNAVIAPGAGIGAWATLGATSFAIKNVPAGATAVGNPARIVLR